MSDFGHEPPVEPQPRRDDEVARALGGIPVPDYEPGFWDRLDARLEREGVPGREAELTRIAVTPVVLPPAEELLPQPLELTRVVPLPTRPRRDRRRSVTVLVAAAAAALAVLAIQVGADDPDTLRIAGQPEDAQPVAPDDGTTTPDQALERDGAERGGDDDGPGTADEGQVDDPGTAIDSSELTPTTTVSLFGSGTAPQAGTIRALPANAQDAFVQWATAIDTGDVERAVQLTGPRTIRYYDALDVTPEGFIAEAGESWGVYADGKDRHIQPVELGKVDGDRAVGLVIDRPSPDDEDADGREYTGVPVVLGDHGWQVEPAAFDPTKDARIEMISPAEGNGLEDLPKDGVIRFAAKRTGEYYLNLDFSQSTHIPASDAVDGVITWNPGGQRSSITHLLVVAHLDAGQVSMLAQTFETAPAPTTGTASRSAG